MEAKVVTARLPLALVEHVDDHAALLRRSRAWVVRQALAAWVDWEEEKWRRTLEGMADVEAGRVIDDEDVRAWIESLSTDSPLPPPTVR
jgi:predicted transcriptional regulator